MEDSSMDMTTVCSTVDATKTELYSVKEKNEVLLQENYELRNKLEVLNRVNKELENDLKTSRLKEVRDPSTFKDDFQQSYEFKRKIELLEKMNSELDCEVLHLNKAKAKESTKLSDMKTELDFALTKINRLETLLEEEREHFQKVVREVKQNEDKIPESNTIIVPDQEQLNLLTNQIEALEVQKQENLESIEKLLTEKVDYTERIHQLTKDQQRLQDEMLEIKEHLKNKTKDLQNINEVLESAQEEKYLLTAELQTLKASDSNAARGNSLFAEVEENRQKVAAQREVLKLKYINLKKVLSQKQVENNKLKLEIVKIRREEKDDEKTVHQDYSDLIQTYKERVHELEEQLKKVLSNADQPQVLLSEADTSQLQWVDTIIENARKEARNLQEELERRGSNYVVQGHKLFDSQRENRKLRTTMHKLQSEIDELRLKLDTIKSANEDVGDGISPPATDIIVQYQKQKCVKFKEVLVDKSNSSLNKSNTSVTERSSSSKDCNSSLKENNPVVKIENV